MTLKPGKTAENHAPTHSKTMGVRVAKLADNTKMRLNIKTSDTGIESEDWRHIDGVTAVDIQTGSLHWDRPKGKSGSIDFEKVIYFHITEVNEEN